MVSQHASLVPHSCSSASLHIHGLLSRSWRHFAEFMAVFRKFSPACRFWYGRCVSPETFSVGSILRLLYRHHISLGCSLLAQPACSSSSNRADLYIHRSTIHTGTGIQAVVHRLRFSASWSLTCLGRRSLSTWWMDSRSFAIITIDSFSSAHTIFFNDGNILPFICHMTSVCWPRTFRLDPLDQ